MEWNATVVISIVALAIEQLVFLGGGLWYLSSRLTTIESNGSNNGTAIKAVERKVDGIISDFDEHIVDANVHTTLEQRKDFNKRIDDLKATFEKGQDRLEGKVDRFLEIALKQK